MAEGALLPAPTERNHHPFGLSSYALTYTGYQPFDYFARLPAPRRPVRPLREAAPTQAGTRGVLTALP
jgi:hypothetical protein